MSTEIKQSLTALKSDTTKSSTKDAKLKSKD